MVYKPKNFVKYLKLIPLFSFIFLIQQTSMVLSSEEIKVKNENFNKIAEKEIIEEEKINVYIDKYISDPSKGFNVTEGNNTYSLTNEEIVLLSAVIASEANRNSIDDTLAVASVILNRADLKGISPIDVITAPGQFSGYLGDYYLRYIDENGSLKNVSDAFINTVYDSLNGVRNNMYYSFRSWSTTGYSDNYIVEYGNRYN
ncbi:MAG: cell wall hydrolase [Bacilli bacterium]|nr:cell wall hydrolase [Bacilli bacterium]